MKKLISILLVISMLLTAPVAAGAAELLTPRLLKKRRQEYEGKRTKRS